MSQQRVLFAPRNIAGQCSLYADGLKELGYAGEVWSYNEPVYGYHADLIVDVNRFRTDMEFRWDLIDRAVRNFDIFHLQYARGLFLDDPTLPRLYDLPLLRAMGKRVVMTFHGSDVRLRSMHIRREPDSYMLSPDVVCDEQRIREDIELCRRYCDAMIVTTPGLLDYVPDAVWMPHVVDVDWWAAERNGEPEIPVVVHSPSSRATKSSHVVDSVCVELDAAGIIDYRPLWGADREQVRAAFRSADIVVDSLAIGDHGLVSVEAMAAGALAVAHIHPRNRERNPGVPVVEATVHDLRQVLERLASSPEERSQRKVESSRWVRERHSVESGANFLHGVYSAPVRAIRSARSWPILPPARQSLPAESGASDAPASERPPLLRRVTSRPAVRRILRTPTVQAVLRRIRS